MNRKMLCLLLVLVMLGIPDLNRAMMQPSTIAAPLSTGADLYIKDTPTDVGTEPNPDTGAMWISQDIWVTTTPDPNYQPYPFPEASPTWIPLPHENPEYRDPKYSLPNYVYVRVRNRGSSASSGTEQLRLYWAKASTGLGWPTQWVDDSSGNCGTGKLSGTEITKPRKNAATATAIEREAYVQAILNVGSPAFVFPNWAISYWHKQQEVHSKIMPNYPYAHGSPAFLSWHREMVNRYEALLQESDPKVKLLYWDWTTDPANSTGGFNFFTTTFMGASGRGTSGVSIGPPFMPALAPPTVIRNLNTSTTPPPNPDAVLLAKGTYGPFAPSQNALAWDLEKTPNHNSAHGYIGGAGDMSFPATATRDPFFFLLHTNVDRLWAQWQRNTSVLSRLDPPTTYDSESANPNITTNLGPWDGTGNVQPWTPAGGYIVQKSPQHPSIVSPPIYDTAPLVIPVLQPGEAVVIQIPWYPPNPNDFACFGGDQGHFCLLARIETSASAPFGMTFPEGPDINANTRNNNNIAWKNVSVVDNFPGAFRLTSVFVRNIFNQRVNAGLNFANTQEFGGSFFDFGRIFVDLKTELFNRWIRGGAVGSGIKIAGDREFTTVIEVVSPEAFIKNIQLEPGEVFSVDVRFLLSKNYPLPRGVVPKWNLIQTGAPGNPNAIVGGQQFDVDFKKLVLVKTGSNWRYLADASNPGPNWPSLTFDDSAWGVGQAELGYGDNPVTTIGPGLFSASGRITTYFRNTFDVTDPSFYRNLFLRLKRDDGAVVYLNGTEIHRVNLPGGVVTPNTLATRAVAGLEEEIFFPIPVNLGLLRAGRNVVAVEIHQNSARSPDLSFDLELCANLSFANFPPDVTFRSPANGSLLPANQVIAVEVEALDSDGQVVSVSLFADGQLIGTDNQPPYTFQWGGTTLGPHRLRAVALDNDQQRATSDTTVTVVENVPPIAQLTEPGNATVFPVNSSITVSAQASDIDGQIERVEFYLRDGHLFDTPDVLVGSAQTAPYTITLTGLTPGHYMLVALAWDNHGAPSQSIPVHFEVSEGHSTTGMKHNRSARKKLKARVTLTKPVKRH